MPNFKRIGGGPWKPSVDLTWNDPYVIIIIIVIRTLRGSSTSKHGYVIIIIVIRTLRGSSTSKHGYVIIGQSHRKWDIETIFV